MAKHKNNKEFDNFYASFVELINKKLLQFGAVKDVLQLVYELSAEDDVVQLAEKLVKQKSDQKDLYILIASAIIKVVKNENSEKTVTYDGNKIG